MTSILGKNVLIFGTSITWGAWDLEGGWAIRLKKLIDKDTIKHDFQEYTSVYVLGVSGNKTTELLNRFDNEVTARLDEGRETVIVVEIGINDSQYNNKTKQHRVPLQEYQQNINVLIEKSRKYKARLCFVGLSPVDVRVDPTPWDPDKSYRPDFVQMYDSALQQVCFESQTQYIKIYNKFPPTQLTTLLQDGLHPSTTGHAIIFEEVAMGLTLC